MKGSIFRSSQWTQREQTIRTVHSDSDVESTSSGDEASGAKDDL